ncbi:lysine-specific demethylase 4A-like isoform X2 [Symsagittifera roscoffensis]|uniref:lysine-specific demethylase 4A-like isoform X2 n=1 Tax=Symsagittifera roscoffensis TaxID=84072 RepID=UPI00307C9EE4
MESWQQKWSSCEGIEIEGVSKCLSGGGEFPVFTYRPSWEEFQDFQACIRRAEAMGAHKTGICKIIPPKEYMPQTDYSQFDSAQVQNPIRQTVDGSGGVYRQINTLLSKKITVRHFRDMAMSDKYMAPVHTRDEAGWDELERKYWRNMTLVQPIYGADIDDTVTDASWDVWNFQRLPSLLDIVSKQNVRIVGVNTPYLYYGMWKATFPWHTEDMDLYSINYIHYGEPKTWYVIPPEHGKRFEVVAKGRFAPTEGTMCENFLRHKTTIISPSFLKKENIPCSKTVQRAGEIVVTFPFAYHQGFNHGFNCAEATNFATERWIEFGKWATHCGCREDAVKIDMDVFVQLYQPERYFRWRNGTDENRVDYHKLHYPKLQSRVHLSLSSNRGGQHKSTSNSVTLEKIGTDFTTNSSSNRKRKKDASNESETNGLPKNLCLTSAKLNLEERRGPRVDFLVDDGCDSDRSDSTELASDDNCHGDQNSQSELTSSDTDVPWKLTPQKCRLFWKKMRRNVRGLDLPQMTNDEEEDSVLNVVGFLSNSCAVEYLAKLFEPLYQFAHSLGGYSNKAPGIIPGSRKLSDCDEAVEEPEVKNVFDAFNSSASGTPQKSIAGCSIYMNNSPVKSEQEGVDDNYLTSLRVNKMPILCSKSTNEADRYPLNQQEEVLKKDYVESKNVNGLSQSADDELQSALDDQYDPCMPIEVSMNLSDSHLWPKCAVCSIFRVFYRESENKLSSKHEKIRLKYEQDGFEASKPLISDLIFVKTKLLMANSSPVKGTTQITALNRYSEIKIDTRKPCPILKCKRCYVSVHATCYGVSIDQFSADEWKCDPCALSERGDTSDSEDVHRYPIDKRVEHRSKLSMPTCLLCMKKGGAFKRVSKVPLTFNPSQKHPCKVVPGKSLWVHVACAIAVPEALFTDLQHHSVDLSRVDRMRTSLNCSVCHRLDDRVQCESSDSCDSDFFSNREMKYLSACLQCFNEYCTRSVHLPCAMHSRHWTITPSCHPITVKLYCRQHTSLASSNLLTTERTLNEGSAIGSIENDRANGSKFGSSENRAVVVKTNRNFKMNREGIVLQRKPFDFYRVLFDDGLESKDLLAENFFGHDWVARGVPRLNDRVNILWSDEQLHQAKFTGIIRVNYCQVLFHDDASLQWVEEKNLLSR